MGKAGKWIPAFAGMTGIWFDSSGVMETRLDSRIHGNDQQPAPPNTAIPALAGMVGIWFESSGVMEIRLDSRIHGNDKELAPHTVIPAKAGIHFDSWIHIKGVSAAASPSTGMYQRIAR